MALALMGLPAQADIYTFNVDQCSGTCGPISTGTVAVTQDTPINGISTVRIDVEFNPNTGYGFMASGAGNGDSFFFNILNKPTIAVSFDQNGINTTGWSLVSATAGNLGASGSSLSGFDYALDCAGDACASNGGSKTAPPPLIFDVTAAGLTPASFRVKDAAGDAYFGADVKDYNSGAGNGNTGMIGATDRRDPSPVPEPGSIVLFGTTLAVVVTGLRKSRGSKQLG
jgi:hypothetical protein